MRYIATILLLAVSAAGCSAGEENIGKGLPSGTDKVEKSAPPAKETVISGLVERVVAIGGETTGWAIGRTEVAPGPGIDLQKFLGKTVRATGYYETRSGIERGAYKVFRVIKIEE